MTVIANLTANPEDIRMPEHIDKSLKTAVSKIARLDSIVAETRAVLIDFGERLHALIEGLPESDVQRIGLRVRLVVRGAPLPPEGTKLIVKTLPANEDAVPFYAYEEPGEYEHEAGDEEHDPRPSPFEVRPGASSLMLEALGEGANRFYFEIRCTPGVCVLADVQSEVMRTYLTHLLASEQVVGIKNVDGEPRLVRREANNPDAKIDIGFTALELLDGFLQGVNVILDFRARFNQG